MRMGPGLAATVIAWVVFVSPALAADCTCIGNLSDDFSDGVLDANWLVGVDPGCGSVSEVNGELLLNKAACNGAVSLMMDPSEMTVCGDFDAQVDFRVTGFTANGYGRYASFLVRDVVNTSNRAVIERYAESPPYCNAPSAHVYKAWINTSDNCSASVRWANTSDTSGRFRIQRVGDQLNLYYWTGAWTVLKSGTWVTGAVQIGVYTGTTPVVGTASQAYFDNLAITSQGCPTSVRAAPTGGVHLLQNYPNPFNPETNIAFTVPAPGAGIGIEIFDLRGHRVRTLLRGWSDGGSHSVPWDGKDDKGGEVPSGMYFCRLRSTMGADTRKIALLR